MLNHSADYALRAVLFLAQQPRGSRSNVEAVSAAIGVPRNYLGKVLNTLARKRVLSSVRGPRGGFRLAADPAGITLENVIEPFQRLPERRMCLLGNRPCDQSRPCSVHTRWRRMSRPVTDFFRETTIDRLLKPEQETGDGT